MAVRSAATVPAGQRGGGGIVKPLDIHRFPLTGQSLIEASAGTGKTWTINQLYRRLLLGHGEVPAPGGRRLGSADILVVTFTRAATEELRGRIRSGLRDAFESLLAAEYGNIRDKDVARWVKEVQAASDISLEDLRDWLQLNLAQMDEAPVNTIHAFCARMLKRFAFDSRTGFELAVETDSQPYLRQACEDVWRQFCYPAQKPRLGYITAAYAGPEALFQSFRSWMSKPDLTVLPPQDLSFDQAFAAAELHFEQASTLWRETGAGSVADLISASGVNKRSYSSRNLPGWLAAADACLRGPFSLPLSDKLENFSQTVLEEKTPKGEAPRHALFSQISQLLTAQSQVRQALDLTLFRRIYARLLTLLEQAAVMTSDDQLRLLDQALMSEQGDALAAQIRALYPVAMIDEFQDTDPVQYRIFSRIYPAADNAKDYALIMIGDPKQAIYAFRGADIFTYMKARTRIAAERSFTLDTNYRSHSELVSAVNTLWQNREQPFIYEDGIGFYPVKSGRLHEKTAPVWEPGVPADTLQIWYDARDENTTDARARVAGECAQQIRALLGGAAHYPAKGRKTLPVVAGDIAVLVATHSEAEDMRRALTAEGIGSVFLTRESVYQSAVALDLLIILEAIAHPGNEAAVRRALATPSWGCSAADLVAMQQDEALWESQLAMIHAYQQAWARRGVMAMLMQWLEDDERAVRLRQRHDGERVLTNLLHLGELLQARSRKVRGHAALLRWLHDKVLDASDEGEEAQLRLETDDRLVTISTIHKSKGLEYPVVFLPFLWAESAVFKGTDITYYNGHEVVRNLAPDDKARELQRRDHRAERLRLLYVALTRARYACFVWLSDARVGNNKMPNWPSTALGYLLNTETPAELDLPGVYLGPRPHWTAGMQAELEVPLPPVQAATARGQWRDAWRVGSYSQLAAQASHQSNPAQAEQAGADLGQALDLEAASAPAPVPVSGESTPLPLSLAFPKGVNPGTCLHSIFEHWDFSSRDQLLELCQRQLPLYGLAEQPVSEVADWLSAIVRQPFLLYDTSACLADIAPAQRLDEMEFYLPVGHLTAAAVDALLGSQPGQPGRFHFEPLTGYLKGFIDLIFEWNGRYYVADYKSNYLGDQLADYRPAALRQSMREHSYDLQSWIYLVALDQLLSQRLPDYVPQKHLGGSVYLYLRGMGDHFSSTDEDTDLGVCFTPASVELLRQWRTLLLQGGKDSSKGSGRGRS
ncbi:MAG: exodeoxyribonuclease V subunit beta [Oceanospirillaceae bacterium]|nr:exodeoxyribonuclease V subunit beta [Oceanospirillaceae bacterium]|tara:strand:+ start:23058 stop:26714 length:3657 start_codon:yes stop_codon:yes gene_type:complete